MSEKHPIVELFNAIKGNQKMVFFPRRLYNFLKNDRGMLDDSDYKVDINFNNNEWADDRDNFKKVYLAISPDNSKELTSEQFVEFFMKLDNGDFDSDAVNGEQWYQKDWGSSALSSLKALRNFAYNSSELLTAHNNRMINQVAPDTMEAEDTMQMEEKPRRKPRNSRRNTRNSRGKNLRQIKNNKNAWKRAHNYSANTGGMVKRFSKKYLFQKKVRKTKKKLNKRLRKTKKKLNKRLRKTKKKLNKRSNKRSRIRS